LDAFCVDPRPEVGLRYARDGRTLLGRADAVDAAGTVVEFKLHVAPTAMRQIACYLAMIGGGTGLVVGLHDAVVRRVVVADPAPILAACLAPRV
jgi:hypothetical protein